ncbi:MAG: hypothetical protein K0R39_4210 [Symbiobacteriaceae bacterium]|jgi:hypothetical protein|nr:hypothetical protein [Symbiobacteriaceae bacterium]
MESNAGLILVWALIVLLSIAGGIVGIVVLYRQNKAKTERTQAMFGVGGPGAPGQGPGGFGPGPAPAQGHGGFGPGPAPAQGHGGFGPGTASAGSQAVVVGKRTYQWPDRLGHYVTFQVPGQAPAEVEVSPEWYAYLNPGDRGALSFQGGQFGGFARVG